MGFLRGMPQNIPKFVMGFDHGGLIAARLMQDRKDYWYAGILAMPLLAFKKSFGPFSIAKLKVQSMTTPNTLVDMNLDKDTLKFLDYVEKSQENIS